MVSSFRDLAVWQKAMELVELIYMLANRLLRKETCGLVSQLQRGTASVRSNIAEGHARESAHEYLRYLLVARCSLAELETRLLLCARLRLPCAAEIEPALSLSDEIGKMFRGLQCSLNNKLNEQNEQLTCRTL